MNSTRFPELDALRGLAILLMIIFHTSFDLFYFYHYSIPIDSPILVLIGHTSAILFLILVGISLQLKYFKLPNSKTHEYCHAELISASAELTPQILKQVQNDSRPSNSSRLLEGPAFLIFLKKGLQILTFALLITLLTSLLPAGTIYFGILHLIGTATIFTYPFLKFKHLNLFLALAVFATPRIFAFLLTTNYYLPTTPPWLLPLGLFPPRLFMLDYYPIFPWFGFILLGVWLASILYADRQRNFPLLGFFPNFSLTTNLPRRVKAGSQLLATSPLSLLSFLGRHSLPIYLLHQPLILGLLWLLSFFTRSNL